MFGIREKVRWSLLYFSFLVLFPYVYISIDICSAPQLCTDCCATYAKRDMYIYTYMKRILEKRPVYI